MEKTKNFVIYYTWLSIQPLTGFETAVRAFGKTLSVDEVPDSGLYRNPQ
jgi:hypothetical protein